MGLTKGMMVAGPCGRRYSFPDEGAQRGVAFWEAGDCGDRAGGGEDEGGL